MSEENLMRSMPYLFSLAEGIRGEKRKRDPEDEGEEEDD